MRDLLARWSPVPSWVGAGPQAGGEPPGLRRRLRVALEPVGKLIDAQARARRAVSEPDHDQQATAITAPIAVIPLVVITALVIAPSPAGPTEPRPLAPGVDKDVLKATNRIERLERETLRQFAFEHGLGEVEQ